METSNALNAHIRLSTIKNIKPRRRWSIAMCQQTGWTNGNVVAFVATQPCLLAVGTWTAIRSLGMWYTRCTKELAF